MEGVNPRDLEEVVGRLCSEVGEFASARPWINSVKDGESGELGTFKIEDCTEEVILDAKTA